MTKAPSDGAAGLSERPRYVDRVVMVGITMQSTAADESASRFSDAVGRAMAQGDIAALEWEPLAMDVGLRCLPADPDTKAPYPRIAPHGVKEATDDPVTLRNWVTMSDPAGMAVVPGASFAMIDDDTGSLDLNTRGLAGTFIERTRLGVHAWAQFLDGRRLREARLPDGAEDSITGDRAYVLNRLTAPYRPVDLIAPIRRLPDDSPLWVLAAARGTPAPSLPGIDW